MIVPFWGVEMGTEYFLYSGSDSAAVGDLVQISFEPERVVSDTVFGSKALVIRLATSLIFVKDNG